MIESMTGNLIRYMDLLSVSQKLTASNIANADTPNYKTKAVDFQFEFMAAVEGQAPQTTEPSGLVEKPDGNNVSVDREMRLLSENAIRFNLAATLLQSHIKMVRKAIDEGKNV